jgi:guanylate kinase
MQQGNIFIISAPSGAGKSSLVKALCSLDKQIKVSVSHTTRPKREGEKHGVHYFFISREEFARMLLEQQFLEYAKVYDNYYGTHIATIQHLQDIGQDIILEIDWQGANQVRRIYPLATLIFILPPSLDELRRRLVLRNTDSKEIIQQRLNLAADDISHAKEFDYIVINDDFDTAVQDLYSIILVQRLKAEVVLDNYKI